jgi:hypothetical protein
MPLGKNRVAEECLKSDPPRPARLFTPSGFKARDSLTAHFRTMAFFARIKVLLGVQANASKNPSERYLLLVISPVFVLGVAMLYQEIVKWRNKRRELYGEASARLPLSEKLRSIRERFQPSVKSTENDQRKNAA